MAAPTRSFGVQVTSTVELPTIPPGAVLVRVPAGGAPSWVRGLPPVPRGDTVTVTVSSERLREVPADDLVSHGYRIVGVHGRRPRGSGDVVDVFVPPTLRRRHPVWWQALISQADRAFDCDHGPVRRLLGAELSLHLAALEGPGTTIG